MYKFILAMAMALACAIGGGHKGTVNHQGIQTAADSTGGDDSGGDNGHIHG